MHFILDRARTCRANFTGPSGRELTRITTCGSTARMVTSRNVSWGSRNGAAQNGWLFDFENPSSSANGRELGEPIFIRKATNLPGMRGKQNETPPTLVLYCSVWKWGDWHPKWPFDGKLSENMSKLGL